MLDALMRNIVVSFFLVLLSQLAVADIHSEVTHGFADSDGVEIHYATVGEGPLVVMIHGFPDYWYTWRHQMAGLRDHYQVVAIDQRGYNQSGQPSGDENYDMKYLVADVAAVIRHFGHSKAIVVGHDWGGVVAWNVAYTFPQMVDKLVVLNLPHPNGMAQYARNSTEPRSSSHYAEVFRRGKPSDPNILFGGPMNPQTLARWVQDPEAKKHYEAAFAQSNFSAMLAYYKRNYPPLPAKGEPSVPALPSLTMPVLLFHGLKDFALPSGALNNTWDWVDNDFTLVTTPEAGHFIQGDAPELVTSTLQWWLRARP